MPTCKLRINDDLLNTFINEKMRGKPKDEVSTARNVNPVVAEDLMERGNVTQRLHTQLLMLRTA